MTKESIRQSVLDLWSEFALDPYAASVNEMQAFHLWLMVEHPSLVDWPVPDGHDRWDDVRAWLVEFREEALRRYLRASQ